MSDSEWSAKEHYVTLTRVHFQSGFLAYSNYAIRLEHAVGACLWVKRGQIDNIKLQDRLEIVKAKDSRYQFHTCESHSSASTIPGCSQQLSHRILRGSNCWMGIDGQSLTEVSKPVKLDSDFMDVTAFMVLNDHTIQHSCWSQGKYYAKLCRKVFRNTES